MKGFSENALYLPLFVPFRTVTRKNKKFKLFKCSKGRLKIAETKDRHSGTYSTKYTLVPKDKFIVWFKWSCGKNQWGKKSTGVRYCWQILPKRIYLNEENLVSFGLLEAEMTKKTYNNLIFTNSEPTLVNRIINFFKIFRIPPKSWSWNITFNFKLKNSKTAPEINQMENEATKFWLKNTKISLKSKPKKFIQYTGNKKTKNMNVATTRHGTLRILFSDKILFEVIRTLLERIKPIVERNAHLALPYMQGIFAGEGDIKLTRRGSVDSVRIGASSESSKKHYAKCLKTLGITPVSWDKYNVALHNQKNFYKVYELRLTSLHPERHLKFIFGSTNFKKFQTLELKQKYSKIVQLENNIVNEHKVEWKDLCEKISFVI